MYLYSPSTNGFYKKEIHGDNIPLDVVEISDEEHKRLYDAGMSIKPNEQGYPEIFINNEPDPVLVQLEENKKSAMAKLSALGLNEDEVQAIIGGIK